jgi:hypothetical protein
VYDDDDVEKHEITDNPHCDASVARINTSTFFANILAIADDHWRDRLKTTIRFPTWVVPSAACQAVLQSKTLKDYLGHVIMCILEDDW